MIKRGGTVIGDGVEGFTFYGRERVWHEIWWSCDRGREGGSLS